MNSKKAVITVLGISLLAPAQAERLYKEKEYQNLWCKNQGGQTEYVLPDSTRIDCLIDEYAIEFDFANKWAEAIGQSLYYGNTTGKKSGIVLILENKNKDEKYLKRLLKVANLHNITVWIITPDYINKNCK